MTEDHGGVRPSGTPENIGPRVSRVGVEVDLSEQALDDGVDQIFTPGDMTVESHGAASQSLGQPPHRQLLEALSIDYVDGLSDQLISGELTPLQWPGLNSLSIGC
jgi:hypothetical protein